MCAGEQTERCLVRIVRIAQGEAMRARTTGFARQRSRKQGVEQRVGMRTANGARHAPVADDVSLQCPRSAAQDDSSALPLDTRLKQTLLELAELNGSAGNWQRKVMAVPFKSRSRPARFASGPR